MKWLINTRRWTCVFIGAFVIGAVWIVVSRVENPIGGSSAPPNPQVGFTAPEFHAGVADRRSNHVD